MDEVPSEELREISQEKALAIEAVARLHQLAVERFYDRRRLEWRLAFTIWAGLILAANALADVDLGCLQRYVVAAALVLVVAVHALWQFKFVAQPMEKDRKEAYYLSAVQMRALGLPPNVKMNEDYSVRSDGVKVMAHFWQVAITAALSLIVGTVIW